MPATRSACASKPSTTNPFPGWCCAREGGAVESSDRDQELACIGEKECELPFTVGVRKSGFVGRTITMQAEAFDAAGNSGMSNSLAFQVRRSGDCPIVSIDSPKDGTTIAPFTLEQFPVRVDARAEVANPDSGRRIVRFRYSASGAALVSQVAQDLPVNGTSPTLSFVFKVKPLSELAGVDPTITITVSAEDDAGVECGVERRVELDLGHKVEVILRWSTPSNLDLVPDDPPFTERGHRIPANDDCNSASPHEERLIEFGDVVPSWPSWGSQQ